MVTKRTRVLSAIAAVLMLVSMVTCFVLPASADEKATLLTKEYLDATYPDVPVPWPDSGLVPFEYYTSGSETVNWAITDAADWRALIAATPAEPSTTTTTFSGHSFYLTEDIDFENVAMAPVAQGAATGGFDANIYGQHHVMRNINIQADTDNGVCMGLIGRMMSTTNRVIRDLGLESGTITATCNTDSEVFLSAFVSRWQKKTFINCWNAIFTIDC